jgi:ribosomal protein S18 acetylase RimI-like enzyme
MRSSCLVAAAPREIRDHAELVALCGGDLLCLWTAQGLDGRSRAWVSGDGRAVAVAGRELSRRDRLAMRGPTQSVIPLAEAVLAETGPAFRPLGERALIESLAAGVPGMSVRGRFGWMDTRRLFPAEPTSPAEPAGATAGWLPDAAMPEVTALLNDGFPESYAWPGQTGVERWAGIRDAAGQLAAVAALAWSAPDVAMISGVAVRPAARGRRFGRAACTFLAREGLARHGAVVLMVEEDNDAARALYGRLGMTYRSVAAAMIQPPAN